MDDDILSELSSDFSSSPDAGADSSAPASAPPDGAGVGEGGEPSAAPEDGANVAPESDASGAGEAVADDAPLDLAKLEALAKERQSAREAQQPTAEQKAEAAEPLTADAIAQAMRSTDTFRQQVTEAVAKGDLATLTRLTSQDPEKADPAGVYERFTKHALDPSGASAADKVAALEAKIAELEGKTLPENVLTTERLQEIEREKAYAANRQAFLSTISDADAYPILANIDESLRLQYGGEAQAAIEAAGEVPTTELLAQISEQVARSKLGGLLAQNSGAVVKSEDGSKSPKAAGAATAGENSGRGAIDNRAASTTAATMPDPDDDEAWDQRLLGIASGSRTH